MILCISPNPALDRTLVVDNLAAGGVHRAAQTLLVADGKGLNVARAARAFGELSTCAGFLGGSTGKQVAALAALEGIATLWTEIEGETRTDVIIVDSSSGDSTVINEPGPTVTARDWERLHTTVMAEAVRWGKRGARINAISPGIIITPLAKDELSGPRGDGYRRMIDVSAVGRAGTPDEVGAVGALLMGPDGAFITGSDFLMDGGVTAAYWYGELASKSN